jgi:diaminopimelate epimerase
MAAPAHDPGAGLAFTKMHGLGNDFVVLDGVRQHVALDAAAVRRLADRHRGVGCDQVLVVEAARDGADFAYRVFNADGGEVEQCGNGARCIARFVRDTGLSAADALTFEVPLRAEVEARDYPLEVDGETLRVAAVSIGNPHAVIAVDDVDGAPVATLGPRIERHPTFPRGANVGFAQRLAADRVRLRVWERGVGETAACGTGACAALVAAVRRGLAARKAAVVLDGGTLEIEWRDDGHVVMAGPVATSFTGVLDASLLA